MYKFSLFWAVRQAGVLYDSLCSFAHLRTKNKLSLCSGSELVCGILG